MKARDVMTSAVISVPADAPVTQVVDLMLQHRISGVPVVDEKGVVVGMVTEGDFLRRNELGTQRKRPRWLEFVIGPGKLAAEYVQSQGRKVSEIMTSGVYTVNADTPLEDVVKLMERRRIKRVPVLDAGKMVGIVSRANLIHAVASLAREVKPTTQSDEVIRAQIQAEVGKQPWAPQIDVVVRDGVVELWGALTDDRERQAFVVAAENVPGVKKVHDHLVWIEPMTGMVLQSLDDEARTRTP
jgi:CBS domain-containing protein